MIIQLSIYKSSSHQSWPLLETYSFPLWSDLNIRIIYSLIHFQHPWPTKYLACFSQPTSVDCLKANLRWRLTCLPSRSRGITVRPINREIPTKCYEGFQNTNKSQDVKILFQVQKYNVQWPPVRLVLNNYANISKINLQHVIRILPKNLSRTNSCFTTMIKMDDWIVI